MRPLVEDMMPSKLLERTQQHTVSIIVSPVTVSAGRIATRKKSYRHEKDILLLPSFFFSLWILDTLTLVFRNAHHQRLP